MSASASYGKKTAALKAVLESKPGATCETRTASRGSIPLVLLFKVMGKMFAILSVRGTENVILKCDPGAAELLREKYAGVGHRSHLDPRFWISVDLDADVPANEIKNLACASYELVCATLTRKQNADLEKVGRG